MTVQEINTLHTACELERTQLLTILAMSLRNPQLAGFLLTGNRSNFLLNKHEIHTQTILMILKHLNFSKTMTP